MPLCHGWPLMLGCGAEASSPGVRGSEPGQRCRKPDDHQVTMPLKSKLLLPPTSARRVPDFIGRARGAELQPERLSWMHVAEAQYLQAQVAVAVHALNHATHPSTRLVDNPQDAVWRMGDLEREPEDATLVLMPQR